MHVAACYISIAVSQLNCLLYGMEEGHGVLPGGNWNMIFFFLTMQNHFNYEVIMLRFYKNIVPNVNFLAPQILFPKHAGIMCVFIYMHYYICMYIFVHCKKSKLHHSLYY